MRFNIARCEHQTKKSDVEDAEDVYEGPVIVLTKEQGLSLCFPILDHTAHLLKYIFEVYNNDEYEELEDSQDLQELEYELTNTEKMAHSQTIGIYQTMVNLWRDSGLFLSGIVMDSTYSAELEDLIVVYMVLSDDTSGFVSSVVRINFQHALALAALLELELNVNEVLLYKLIPTLFEDGDEENENEQDSPSFAGPQHMLSLPDQDSPFPIDSKLVDLAKSLLNDDEKKKKRKKKED